MNFSHSLTCAALVLSIAVTTATAADKVPLVLTLPKAIQIGTPVPVKLANLEKPATGPRPAFLVPPGVVNLAKGKKVSGSDTEPLLGELALLTDGDKAGDEGSYVELGPGKQWVQIDLGASHPLYALALWHFHAQARVYRAVAVQLSDDPDFITGVRTVFNNDDQNVLGFGPGKDPTYVENNAGRIIDAQGIKARYLRLFSAGNTTSATNHYIEVEVYGSP